MTVDQTIRPTTDDDRQVDMSVQDPSGSDPEATLFGDGLKCVLFSQILTDRNTKKEYVSDLYQDYGRRFTAFLPGLKTGASCLTGVKEDGNDKQDGGLIS